MIAILGGGIAGISAGYHLGLQGKEHAVYERKPSWGGLCDNFTVEGKFRFDYFVHLSFAKDEHVRDIFSKSADYYIREAKPYNYYKGYWLKHPAQNNLAALPADVKTKIIIDFINRPEIKNPANYEEWLLAQFGEYFSKNFPGAYTRKYWTIEANQLTTDWLSIRFSLPPLENMLKGAFAEQPENYYYIKDMRYPKKGGYKSFLNGMASQTNIQTGKEVALIDLKTKRIDFTDNTFVHYDSLVSSIPLSELVKRIKDVPPAVREAGEKLLHTSGQLVSLGFNRPDIPDSIWFYIYDEDILPARAYSPSIKSPDNVPEGKSSLQFETYFSRKKAPGLKGGALIEHVIKKGNKMGLFSNRDVEVSDYREVQYANVVFDFNRNKSVEIIHAYLKENHITYCGRFGEWDYLWSDQSLLSGKKAADSYL
jgi:protoporphyrinogen oxidase